MIISQAVQPQSLPELLKNLRRSRNLTQKDLGRLFTPPVAQPTIARWEKGEQNPDRKYFPTLASLLDFTLEELFELIGEPNLSGGEQQQREPAPIHQFNPQHLAILNRGVTAWNRWREKHPEIIPNLAGAEPLERNLGGIDLCNVDLQGAKLHRVTLYNAKLLHTDFRGADLRSANLSDADLRDAIFDNAHLKNTHFVNANLESASFQGANLEGACFYEAHLRNADLRSANLTYVDLRYANLTGVNLSDATLRCCAIYGASTWDITLKGTVQAKLNLCPHDVEMDYVEDLETAYIEFLKRKQQNH